MRQYYLHNGTNQVGVFSFEEIRMLELTPDDYIWYDGLSDWVSVNEVSELKSFIKTADSSETQKDLADVSENNGRKPLRYIFSFTGIASLSLFFLFLVCDYLPEIKYFFRSQKEPKATKGGQISGFNKDASSIEKNTIGSRFTPDGLIALLEEHDTTFFKKIVKQRGFIRIESDQRESLITFKYNNASLDSNETISFSCQTDSVVYSIENQSIFTKFEEALKAIDQRPVPHSQRKKLGKNYNQYRYYSGVFVDMAFQDNNGTFVLVPIAGN